MGPRSRDGSGVCIPQTTPLGPPDTRSESDRCQWGSGGCADASTAGVGRRPCDTPAAKSPHGGLPPSARNPPEHGSPGHPRIAWLVWLAPLGTTQPLIHHPLTRKSQRRKYAAMRVSGWQTDPETARQPALGGSVYRWEASTAGGPPSPDPGPCLVLFVYLERQLWLGAYTPTPQSPLARTPPKWECALALGF